MRVYARVKPSSFAASRIAFEHLLGWLSDPETLMQRHEQVEAMLEESGRELMRQLFQDHLDLRSLRERRRDEVEGSDGIRRTHVRGQPRSLMTVFGPARLSRLGYGAQGTTSLFPLDLELNLPPERYSFGVRRRVAIEASKGSFDETVTSLQSATGGPVPKRQVEQLAQRSAVDFESFYKSRPLVQAGDTDLLVLSTDAKGIVMRTEDLRAETRQAVENVMRTMRHRLTRGEVSCHKRMAQVATVYDVAPYVRTPEEIVREFGPVHELPSRPRPYNKRVWASVEKEPDAILGDLFAEALRRDPQHKRLWVLVIDGHRGQLGALRRIIRRLHLKVTIVLDVVHVLEHLWAASVCFYPEADPRRQDWVTQRLLRVLQGRASGVAAGIRRSATRQGLSHSVSKLTHKCARYLLQYKDLMRYDEYLSLGLPIGSGVIEGACRYLVKDRFAITGARWSLAGAESILQLRALRTSGDFEAYWTFHLDREHERNHLARYKPPLAASS